MKKRYILKVYDDEGWYDVIHPITQKPCVFDSMEEMREFTEGNKDLILWEGANLDFDIIEED